MQTNFFQHIASLQLTGDIKILIRQQDGQLIVSTLLVNEQCGDKARHHIVPLNLTGSPEELDNGYFDTITQPLQQASGLMTNMDAHLKSVEQARLQSQMEKEKAAKEEKAKTERQKKYEEAMKKADELEAAGKYREAWVKVPEVDAYPEHAETIRSRKAALSAQFSPDLFQSPQTNP